MSHSIVNRLVASAESVVYSDRIANAQEQVALACKCLSTGEFEVGEHDTGIWVFALENMTDSWIAIETEDMDLKFGPFTNFGMRGVTAAFRCFVTMSEIGDTECTDTRLPIEAF